MGILQCKLINEGAKCIRYQRMADVLQCYEQSNNKFVVARGDWAAFQILLESNEEATVSIGKSAYFTPMGQLVNYRLETKVNDISENCIQMNCIGFVEDDDRVFKADVLLNDETIYIDKNAVQPVWVEIQILRDLKAGIYKGTVSIYKHIMFEDESVVTSIDFIIDVKDVLLPEVKDRVFYLDLWQHTSNIARKHEVRRWSAEHFEVLKSYIKALAQLGQKAISVIVSEIPWAGQFCYGEREYLSDMFEYSMIQITRDKKGQFDFDFSIMGQYIKLCMENGIEDEIEVFGLINIWKSKKDDEGYIGIVPNYPDNIRLRYFDCETGSFRYIRDAEVIKNYIKTLECYFINNKLIGKVRIVADEPDNIELYKERLEIIKDVAPQFKLKTAINNVEFIGEFKNLITDFVPILPAAFEEWGLLNKMRDTIKGNLLWYVCCIPKYPNTFISSPLVESRLIGLLTSYLELDGFLRWNFTAWPENPRKRMSYKYPNWSAGDTNFVYPANNGKPLLTLRYKILKRGIDDFELVEMLKRNCNCQKNRLKEAWDTVIKFASVDTFYSTCKQPKDLYSLNYCDFDRFKEIILEELTSEVKRNQ